MEWSTRCQTGVSQVSLMSPKLCAALCFSGWPDVLSRALSHLACLNYDHWKQHGLMLFPVVPRVGLEPTLLSEPNFESGTSTNSATRAGALRCARVESNHRPPASVAGDLPLIYTRVNHTGVRAGLEACKSGCSVCARQPRQSSPWARPESLPAPYRLDLGGVYQCHHLTPVQSKELPGDWRMSAPAQASGRGCPSLWCTGVDLNHRFRPAWPESWAN